MRMNCCCWLGRWQRSISLDRTVDESCDGFLLVAVSGGENHHPVADAQRVHVIHNYVVWFRQQRWFTRDGRVLVEYDLEEMGRQDGRVAGPLVGFRLRDYLPIAGVLILCLFECGGVRDSEGVWDVDIIRVFEKLVLQLCKVALVYFDDIVLVALFACLFLVLGVQAPLAINLKLVLKLAFGKVNDGNEILLALHHRQFLPLVE